MSDKTIRYRDYPVPRPDRIPGFPYRGTCNVCHLNKKQNCDATGRHDSTCTGPCPGFDCCRVYQYHNDKLVSEDARHAQWLHNRDVWYKEQQQLQQQNKQKAKNKKKETKSQAKAAQKPSEENKLNDPELEQSLRATFGSDVKRQVQPILLEALMRYTKGEVEHYEPPAKRLKVGLLKINKKTLVNQVYRPDQARDAHHNLTTMNLRKMRLNM